MTTHHADVEVTAGDLWSIDGQLLDRDGSPLDLTNAVIQWALRDPDGAFMTAAVQAANITIAADKTTGLINISVPNNATAGCAAGRYHDSVRVIVEGSYIDTVWVGLLLVDADPFQLDVAPPPLPLAGEIRVAEPSLTIFSPLLLEEPDIPIE